MSTDRKEKQKHEYPDDRNFEGTTMISGGSFRFAGSPHSTTENEKKKKLNLR